MADKKIRISVIEPTGDGLTRHPDVKEGTAVGDYVACYLEQAGKKGDNVTYKVNREEVDSSYVLQQGDRLSLNFHNIAAAGQWSNTYGHHASVREGFKFQYRGSEILPHAQRKLEYFKQETLRCHQDMESVAGLGGRDASSKRDSIISRLRHCDEQLEKCLAWVHEFGRASERVFDLALSDVIYFGVVGGIEDMPE